MTEILKLEHFVKILPEVILFVTAIFTLLSDIGHTNSKGRPTNTLIISLLGISVAFIHSILTLKSAPVLIFSNTFQIDPISQFFKANLIFSGLICIILAWISHDIKNHEQAEMQSILIFSIFSMCIMCSSAHLLLLFISWEMVGFCIYVLAAFKRKSVLSSEAGIKSFIHGALSSTFFALGIALLYGIGKSFYVQEIKMQLLSSLSLGDPTSVVSYLWVAFGLIFVTIASRLLIFPFHFTSVDVVEGAPTPISAFLSVTPVIAAMAFSLRICLQLFSIKNSFKWDHIPGIHWQEFIAAVAAATMTLGNLGALFQSNMKRLLGFSCVAHIGFFLMGLAVSNQFGVAAMLFGLIPYAMVMLGAFFVIQGVSDRAKNENTQILKGLVWKSPFEGVLLCLFLLSLAGLPPLAGFIGRFYVLGVVVQEKLYWLSVVAAINWVIGLACFLSLIHQMFISAGVNKEESVVSKAGKAWSSVLTVFIIPTVLLGIYWDTLMNYITHSLNVVPW